MTLFKKALKWFEKIFQTLFFEIEEHVFPFVVNFLNGVKKLGDSEIVNFIVPFFPNWVDPEKFAKAKNVLNVVLQGYTQKEYSSEELKKYIDVIDTPEELNEFLTEIFKNLSFKDKKHKSEILSTIGARLVQELSGNETNFATAVMQLEYYYKKIHRSETDDNQK